MSAVSLDILVEKKHAPLARIAAGAIESLPGKGTIILSDATAPTHARRSDDMQISLEQADAPALIRRGARHITIRYTDPHSVAATAAVIAAAVRDGMPVCNDTDSLALLAVAQRVAIADIPVLIAGPTGTGKEVMARFIHNTSARRNKPFVAINCAAMPEAMLEAMLFGHVKGAFTGASAASEGFFRAANGGTLLLDEIAEMPISLQAKLLRVLQEGEVVPIGATTPIPVDVRIIAAANRDLPTEVAEGRMRADLYFRLNVFPIDLAALRMRSDDIAPLAFAMLLRHETSEGALHWIDDGALEKLRAHSWPGNIRELENVIRRALLLAGDNKVITDADIQFDMAARMIAQKEQENVAQSAHSLVHPNPVRELPVPRMSEDAQSLSRVGRNSQMRAIQEMLEECRGKKAETAKRLGISERTLRYRLAEMREAGIRVDGAFWRTAAGDIR